MDQEPRKSFVELLDLTNYFEFTDKRKLEELKMHIKDSFEKWRVFNTIFDESGSICHKVFHCDTETLFEADGFESQLQELRQGLQIICDYQLLANFIPKNTSVSSEELSVVEFITIVNSWLRRRNSPYQLYPAYGGNEGLIYILTELQYMLLNKAIRDNHTKPYRIDEWITVFAAKEDEVQKSEVKQELKPGMKIRHHLGIGEVLSISDRGLALVKFSEGERNIILKFAEYTILE